VIFQIPETRNRIPMITADTCEILAFQRGSTHSEEPSKGETPAAISDMLTF
jgi:hypothetical protein